MWTPGKLSTPSNRDESTACARRSRLPAGLMKSAPPMGSALRSGYALPSVRPHRRSHPDCRWILILIAARHGLLNRFGFDAVAAEAFEGTRRWGQPVSALLCDIDAFRSLNDRYGHKAGDRALKNLAEVIKESIGRRSAVLGRQGGDEFVILLLGIDLNEATKIAERLCEACEARALVQQQPAAKFTISVGVGTEALGPSELGRLLRQTDAALYRAKRAGGNQVASGSGRFVQRYSAPSIERFPTRSAKLFVPVTNPGNSG